MAFPAQFISRAGLPIAAAASVLFVSVYATIGWGSRNGRPSVSTVNIPGVTQARVVSAGLSPEALSAAGVSAEQAAIVVSAAAAHAKQSESGLRAAENRMAELGRSTASLRQKLRAGRGGSDDAARLEAARSELAAARSAHAALLEGVYAAGTAQLPESQRSTLASIRSARPTHRLPAPYLVRSRTDADWGALRDALAAGRIAAANGGQAPGWAAATLQSEHGDPTVATARANSDASLAGVAAAWQSAFADESR